MTILDFNKCFPTEKSAMNSSSRLSTTVLMSVRSADAFIISILTVSITVRICTVRRVLKESLPTHNDNGTGIAYAGHEELAPNGFKGYYVCTPNDGVQYCRTKKDAISIVKQYYQGDDRNLVLGQLGIVGQL